jgi:hypothetical protein
VSEDKKKDRILDDRDKDEKDAEEDVGLELEEQKS